MRTGGVVGVLIALVLTVVGTFAVIGAASDAPEAAPGGLSSAVPAEYQTWIQRAGSMCPEISPALVAAQIDAESGWNPDAVSPVGAQGLSQFMPATWPTWGRDDDGNGTSDPFDPGDAIMAQGRFDCWNVERLKGGASGEELIKLVLAAYNAGPYAVLGSECDQADKDRCRPRIPQIPETLAYIDRILALVPKYQGAQDVAGGPGGAASGTWVQPVKEYTVGARFKQYGPSWAWLGYHTGFDYSAPLGTNIAAISAGTVEHASWGSDAGGTGASYGNQVIISHGPDANGHEVRSYYAHLAAFSVDQGDTVRAGQVIGTIGLTGNTHGPHVHVEVTVHDPKMAAEHYFVDPHAYIEQNAAAGDDAAGGGGDAVIQAARSQLGEPYSLGGGTLEGPSPGLDGRTGWDCSSLVRYAWHKGAGKTIPRTTWDQVAALDSVDVDQMRPGDLIFFQTGGQGGWDHVGLYIGDGQMIHAPNPRKSVETVSITSGYYADLTQTARSVR